MVTRRHEEYDANGNMQRIRVWDTNTDTVTTTVTGETPVVERLAPSIKADIVAEETRQVRTTRLETATTVLRDWAADAQTTNVTNGNNTAVTQVMVDRLGVFFDRFADLLDDKYDR